MSTRHNPTAIPMFVPATRDVDSDTTTDGPGGDRPCSHGTRAPATRRGIVLSCYLRQKFVVVEHASRSHIDLYSDPNICFRFCIRSREQGQHRYRRWYRRWYTCRHQHKHQRWCHLPPLERGQLQIRYFPLPVSFSIRFSCI